jgi:hypothetical protein
MNLYEIHDYCEEPWSNKVRSYWKFISGEVCHVLTGKTYGKIFLLPLKLDGVTHHGLLFERPIILPKERNILWHERGHVVVGKQVSSTMDEYFADEWAINECLERGFNLIAKEIILRCKHWLSVDNLPVEYKDSGRMIVKKFSQYLTV